MTNSSMRFCAIFLWICLSGWGITPVQAYIKVYEQINPTFRLTKTVDKSRANVGDVLSYTLVLTNTGTVSASVVVQDSLSAGVSYITGSAIVPTGTTFTPGASVSAWQVLNMAAGQQLSLTFQVTVTAGGIVYNTASIPGEAVRACTTIPVKMCAGTAYRFQLTAPPGRPDYQWYRIPPGSTSAVLLTETSNLLSITAAGTYSLYSANTANCPDFSCCPFIVEEQNTVGCFPIAVKRFDKPVVPPNAGSVLYIGNSLGNFFAIDGNTGAGKWRVSTSSAFTSSPYVAAGLVFTGSDGGTLFAYDTTAGQQRWQFSAGTGILSSPVVSHTLVYVGSEDQNLYAISTATGSLQWKYSTAGGVTTSPTVANGSVFFGSKDQTLYALNASSGQLEWKYSTGAAIRSSPAIDNGRIYFGSDDYTIYALTASTGAFQWKYSTGGKISSSPTVSGNNVFIASEDGTVYALNATTGVLVWKYGTGGPITSSPVVWGGKVFLGGQDYTVYALDTSTGALSWKYSTGKPITSSPIVQTDVVYVGSQDGTLYCLNATTGSLRWKNPLDGQLLASPSMYTAGGSIVAPGISGGQQ
ncbi:outer membrane protein assembly factor BamB family protein [Spirosoma pollinicola]|uniref:Uncharacterized protein n=1 Tax=Spirosoma pollinicola TaxID=2057025 RepID=A0A2K8YUK0_9BACT|nr:PQQ-binding-like beta-propeller repeat protein [Spirosoma pollinicola]AUD01307.1 hypothetical protein CWM47_05470 [Spirosoma pollinicola]